MTIHSLCAQIAGDMLCADQNFDIAQVIRFFRSKVGFTVFYCKKMLFLISMFSFDFVSVNFVF